MKALTCLVWLPLVAAVLSAASVEAGDLGVAPSLRLGFEGRADRHGAPYPWVLRAREGEASFSLSSEGDRPSLRLSCDRASFSLEQPLNLTADDYPILTWSWSAVRLPGRGDVRKRETDDQVLQVIVAFEGGAIMNYVWDTQAPEGTVADASMAWPVNLRIKTLVVRSGAGLPGHWEVVRRNVAEDFGRLFRAETPRVTGLRIQTNCQHTASSAEGSFGPLTFEKADALSQRMSRR